MKKSRKPAPDARLSSANSLLFPNLALRILAARKKLGIGQRLAAKQWGFAEATLQAWEKGRRNPAGLYKEKLERVLRRVLGE